MFYDPNIHHRQSIRLKGYDYSQAGAYFVTVCVQGRACLLGEIVDGKMRLNSAGRMIRSVWNDIPRFYPGVETDEFVVMPNHIHGIFVLVGAGPRACPNPAQPEGVAQTWSLPDVLHRYKTITTKRYVDGAKTSGWTPFHGRLWQRNYYEHIIRNEESLRRIRGYIANNPLHWALDRENPDVAAAKGQTQGSAPTKDKPWYL